MLQINAFTPLTNIPHPLFPSSTLSTSLTYLPPPPFISAHHISTPPPLPLTLLMIYTYPIDPPPPAVSSPMNLFPIFPLNITTPPHNFLYIDNQQPDYLSCTSITLPEDEL